VGEPACVGGLIMKCECGYEIKKPKAEIVGKEWCVICPKCRRIYRLWEVKDEKS